MKLQSTSVKFHDSLYNNEHEITRYFTITLCVSLIRNSLTDIGTAETRLTNSVYNNVCIHFTESVLQPDGHRLHDDRLMYNA